MTEDGHSREADSLSRTRHEVQRFRTLFYHDPLLTTERDTTGESSNSESEYQHALEVRPRTSLPS